MILTKTKLATILAAILSAVVLSASCGANEGILKSGRETPQNAVKESVVDSFEKDVASMKEVGFRWIYVYRRKDGGVLDKEDRAFIRQHTDQANRKVLTDNGKAVLVGSNYFFGDNEVVALSDRFDVTDMSPPGEPPSPEIKKVQNEQRND